MLKIGFTNKYYTIWNVDNENVYAQDYSGKAYLSHIKTNYTYYQNLSFDKDNALEKAKSMGCVNLEVDTELRGQTQSFHKITQRFEAPKMPDYLFQFGKYEGKDIRNSQDVDYLKWYEGQNENESSKYAAKRVCELDNSYTLHKEFGLVSKEELKIYKIQNDILKGKKEVIAISNFSNVEYGHCEIKILVVESTEEDAIFNLNYEYGYRLQLRQELGFELQEKSYNGYTYWTPKGMRSFKNTKFRIKKNQLLIINQ